MTIPPATAPALRDLPLFDPILCAVDFSPSCRRALDMAIAIAQEADARLIVLHARGDCGTRREALARLRRGAPADTIFRCRPEFVVADGRPSDALLAVAAAEDARLIVMGVQSRTAIDRVIFGSTTRNVLRAATCPVLSIRAHEGAAPWDSARPATREVASLAETDPLIA
jgi:nucleotide-binding universal stress UspA family protein